MATYDKREEQVKILNRWIGGKKLSSLSSEELQKFLFILKEKGIDGVNVGYAKIVYISCSGSKYGFNYCNLINENPMKFVKMPKYQLSLKDLKRVCQQFRR